MGLGLGCKLNDGQGLHGMVDCTIPMHTTRGKESNADDAKLSC